MKHTVESLMALVADFAEVYSGSDHSAFVEAQAELHTALSEVMQELAKHRELLVKHLAVIDPLRQELSEAKADRDQLQRDFTYIKQRRDALLVALEKLARLGNGDRYGNSEGNQIAQAALNGVNAP
jgi:predicted RNase H-like nuclease (RuvC/YqgF family)